MEYTFSPRLGDGDPAWGRNAVKMCTGSVKDFVRFRSPSVLGVFLPPSALGVVVLRCAAVEEVLVVASLFVGCPSASESAA